jgi:hypothetical protein
MEQEVEKVPTLLHFTHEESAFAKACYQAAVAAGGEEVDEYDPTSKVHTRFHFLNLFSYTMVCARLYGALARDNGPGIRFENVRMLDGSGKEWAWAWLDTQSGRVVYGEGDVREEGGTVVAKILKEAAIL